MIGINHGLTGGLIARLLPLPFAMPLALASHFLMDMLPHYGLPHHQRNDSRFWKYFLSFDTAATFALAVYAINDRHYAMFFGGLFATMPDYIWVARILKNRSFDLSEHGHWFTHWHAKIQLYERPWGIYIEVTLLIALFYIVMIRLW